MPESTLSTQVIRKDQALEKAHDASQEELARHRWRWTLDESNPKRVTVSEYARAVGRHQSAINIMVRGFQEFLKAGGSLSDHIARHQSGAEKRDAIQAVADARGMTFGSAQRLRKDEANRVRTTAEERAERHGTSVAEELPTVAAEVVKAEKASAAVAKQREERHRKAHTFAYIQIEGQLAAAKRKLMDALKQADDVAFSAEERELLIEAIARIKSVLALIDLRIAGTADVDWDAELAKLGEN